jgi:Bacterial dnaA protein helix-turn-helix
MSRCCRELSYVAFYNKRGRCEQWIKEGKLLTPYSLPEIGRRYGGRDHTTVLHAIRKIQGLTTTDGTLSEEIDRLKQMLLE